MNRLFSLDTLPEDPLFGVDQRCRRDPRPERINLTLGAYRDEEGRPYPLPSVLEAERRLSFQEKEYLPIEGALRFREALRALFERALGVPLKESFIVQTLGGTGALSLGAKLFSRGRPGGRVHLPRPTWANHSPLFQEAGLKLANYRYPGLEGMLEGIAQLEPHELYLLQLVCQNPTGLDPAPQEWEAIAKAFERGRGVPFFDLAYLGFGEGIKEDLWPLTLFLKRGIPFFLALSCSKSFGLYGERVGALLISSEGGGEALFSHVKQLIRTSYSNPPRHGSSLVSEILQDPLLMGRWEEELAQMRERLKRSRSSLLEALPKSLPSVDGGRGMFALLPLIEGATLRLAQEEALYLPASGRISFAGLLPSTVSRVAKALAPFLL